MIVAKADEIHGPLEGTVTFMRVPYSLDLSDSKAAILGVPYDMGTHPVRIGDGRTAHRGVLRKRHPCDRRPP
jgi:hypothetical protein